MDFEVVAQGQNDVFLNKHKPCLDWEQIKNINDPYVQEMGRFAVMEHTKHLCGVGLHFMRVVSGETLKVLEGKKCRLLIEVKEVIIDSCITSSIKLYVAIVLDKECDQSWKLLNFEEALIKPHFGPGPVIPDA